MSAPEVLAAASRDDLLEAAAGMLVTTLVERQAETGRASLVLTGGGIGIALLARLRETSGIDWTALDVWWGDERYLADGDRDRNETQAREALLDHVPVDPARVHPIAGPDRSIDAEDAAAQYADHLARHALHAPHTPPFDVVLLGIGPDAHVASLFPELPGVHELERTVVAVHGSPKPPPTRVSLTFPAINSAAQVWILASGSDKREAVRLALDPQAGRLQVPAAGVHGVMRTCLLLDHDAASALPTGAWRPIA